MADESQHPRRAPWLSFADTVGGWGISPLRARIILGLAGPVILGMLTQTAVNLVDTAMVGRLPTEASVPGQAALGISMPVFWMVGGFLASIQVGTQAIVARRYGEGQFDLAGRALMNSVMVAVVTALPLSAIALWLVPAVFPFFHSDPEVIRWGVPYLQVRLIGLLSMVATASVKGFYDGIGKTYVHMIAALVMNILNIFGNWVFIFGRLGAPRLEVTGAAVASTLSTYIGLAIMMYWTTRTSTALGYRPYRWENRSRSVSWDIVRLGLPSGVSTVAMMFGFLLFLKMVAGLDARAGHGAVYTAATKVVIDILSITFMSCMAFGTATATMVGQSLGRGKLRRAELYGWESVKLGLYVFGVVGVFTILFPDAFIGIFSKDLAVIEAARPALRVVGFSEGLVAAAMILMQAMFGAGNAKLVGYVTLAFNFLVLLPAAWVLGMAFHLELVGMWLALVLYILAVAVVLGWKFYQGDWKHLQV